MDSVLQTFLMANESLDLARKVYNFLEYYFAKTVHYLKLSKFKELTFRFTERAGTAYASRDQNSRGEDIYVLAFNPYFFVRNAIVYSLDLDVLFQTILFHEFAHVKLRHLRPEISIEGHEKFIRKFPRAFLIWFPRGLTTYTRTFT
jgi:hypothetical protein